MVIYERLGKIEKLELEFQRKKEKKKRENRNSFFAFLKRRSFWNLKHFSGSKETSR